MTKNELVEHLGIAYSRIGGIRIAKRDNTKVFYRLMMLLKPGIVEYLKDDSKFVGVVPIDRIEAYDMIKNNLDNFKYNVRKKNGGLYEQKIYDNTSETKRISKHNQTKIGKKSK